MGGHMGPPLRNSKNPYRRADEDIGPYARKTARPAVHRPRCMLHRLGALYLVRSRWSSSLRRTAVIKFRHPSRGFRAGRNCRRNSATPLGPGPQARYWPPTMNPAERFMVGKEEQGSGVGDTQTWVSRTKRTLRRRGYFPSLESSPPAGGTSPKTKQRFRPAGRVSF